jgi:hypothetical protein
MEPTETENPTKGRHARRLTPAEVEERFDFLSKVLVESPTLTSHAEIEFAARFGCERRAGRRWIEKFWLAHQSNRNADSRRLELDKKLDGVFVRAMERGQLSVAVAAIRARAKLHGLETDNVRIDGSTVQEMSITELMTQLAKARAENAAIVDVQPPAIEAQSAAEVEADGATAPE